MSSLKTPGADINWPDVWYSTATAFFIVAAAVFWLLWRDLPYLPAIPMPATWLIKSMVADWLMPNSATAWIYREWLGRLTDAGLSYIVAVRLYAPLIPATIAAAWIFLYTSKTQDDKRIQPDQKMLISDAEAKLEVEAEFGKKAGFLFLGKTPIPKEKFLKSFFIFGATGSGKTQTIWSIVRQLIDRKDYKLLFLDGPKGDFSQSMPPETKPLIIAPWHAGEVWAIAEDISERAHAVEFFAAAVPASNDPMWSNAARGIGIGNMCRLIDEKPGTWTWADLYRECTKPLEEQKTNAEIYYPPALESLRDPESKTTQSIMINLHAYLAPIFEIATGWGDRPGTFSFKKWWSVDAANVKNKIVIMQLHPVYNSTSTAFAAGIINLLAQYTKSSDIGESKTRNNCMVLDEFFQLPKMDSFSVFIDLGRSKACSVIGATQSPGQLIETYGINMLNSWFSSLGLKIYGGIQGDGDLSFVEKNLGKHKFNELKESVTQSADGRESVSRSWQEGEKFLVDRVELERLGADKRAGGCRLIVDGLKNPFRLFIPFIDVQEHRAAYVKNLRFGHIKGLNAPQVIASEPDLTPVLGASLSTDLADRTDDANPASAPVSEQPVTHTTAPDATGQTTEIDPFAAADPDDPWAGSEPADATATADSTGNADRTDDADPAMAMFTDPELACTTETEQTGQVTQTDPLPDWSDALPDATCNTDRTDDRDPASARVSGVPEGDEIVDEIVQDEVENMIEDQISGLTGIDIEPVTQILSVVEKVAEAAGPTQPAALAAGVASARRRRAESMDKIAAARAELTRRGEPITNSAIAALAGISTKTVSRILQEAEE